MRLKSSVSVFHTGHTKEPDVSIKKNRVSHLVSSVSAFLSLLLSSI